MLLDGGGVVDPAVVGDHGLPVILVGHLLITLNVVISLHEHALVSSSNQDLLRYP